MSADFMIFDIRRKCCELVEAIGLPVGVVEEVTKLCREFHAKEVILYGLRAKNTARERSDIDIAVIRKKMEGKRMGMFLNRGTKEFEQAVNSRIYVDKTDMIFHLNQLLSTEQRYVCVSRPRRFGKSITANMIAAYYEKGSDSSFLFEKRKLAKKDPTGWNKQMNRYDVIRIDLAELRAQEGRPEAALDFLEKSLLKDLKEAYQEEVKTNFNDGKLAEVLDCINRQANAQFVIIIDEWDAFFRDEKSNQGVQNRYIDLLRSLFKGNRSKNFLALAYITGILPIKRYNSESALNNFYDFKQSTPSIGAIVPHGRG